MTNAKPYTNEEILNKGAYVKFANVEYYCYNETEHMMHFVKLNKNGSFSSLKNKSNLMNFSKDRVFSLIKLGSATITVGQINN